MLTRGMLGVVVICLVLTAVLLLTVAWSGVVMRGGAGLVDCCIAAQSALYAALPAWGLAWLDTRIKFPWHPKHRGPKLLPPASNIPED